jgi:hypothetical protein
VFVNLSYQPNSVQNAGKTNKGFLSSKNFCMWERYPNNYNKIFGILQVHVQTAVTQKNCHLSLPGEGRGDLRVLLERTGIWVEKITH